LVEKKIRNWRQSVKLKYFAMPNEYEALSAFFRAQEKKAETTKKRQRPADPRRSDLATCTVVEDRNKNGRSRFKGNVCCKKLQCSAKFSPSEVLVLRQSLINRHQNSVDRRAFLSNRYNPGLCTSRGSGKFYCDTAAMCRLEAFSSGNKHLPVTPLDLTQVCLSFFCWVYDVSKDQMRHQLSTRIQPAKRYKVLDSPKQWSVEQWLVDLSQYYQAQPDSDVVLLPFANRTSVWQMYLLDAVESKFQTVAAVAKSYFPKCWRESGRTKNIRLRKHLRFTKCDTCVDLRERKGRTMDPKLLDAIREEEYEHYQFVKEERGGYYNRRNYAVHRPKDAMSVIIDGADWYNYAVPYFATKTHESSKIFRAPIYLMGVISHGRGSKCFLVPGHFKQGTNVVLDVFIRTLMSMKANGENIPPRIYLQLDNTAKQNKNKYLMGMLGYLVHIGVTEKIIVSFLPKGHTHEDIDQLFSRLVIALMCRDAKSVKDLMTIISSAYSDKMGRRTETETMSSVANLSDWIGEYLNPFDGLSAFRQFLITRKNVTDPDSPVIMRVRKNGVSGRWRGIDHKTEFTTVFKVVPPRYVKLNNVDGITMSIISSVIPVLDACQLRPTPEGDDLKSYETSLEKVYIQKPYCNSISRNKVIKNNTFACYS